MPASNPFVTFVFPGIYANIYLPYTMVLFEVEYNLIPKRTVRAETHLAVVDVISPPSPARAWF